jgi:predicted nucleic acid-binding protein
MIYLDSSALVTYTVERPYADALKRFLDRERADTCTSTIGFIETVRTCDRIGNYPRLLSQLLREHDEILLSSEIRDHAARIPGPIRSLDAIHVASAALLGADLTSLVTYDNRMAEAAAAIGLPVDMPGMK